eukprot:m.130356 g.130356  ORF g.130356 m.130356 type:complete len:1666 (-) comp15720_c0_seq1:225-5222(-)
MAVRIAEQKSTTYSPKKMLWLAIFALACIASLVCAHHTVANATCADDDAGLQQQLQTSQVSCQQLMAYCDLEPFADLLQYTCRQSCQICSSTASPQPTNNPTTTQQQELGDMSTSTLDPLPPASTTPVSSTHSDGQLGNGVCSNIRPASRCRQTPNCFWTTSGSFGCIDHSLATLVDGQAFVCYVIPLSECSIHAQCSLQRRDSGELVCLAKPSAKNFEHVLFHLGFISNGIGNDGSFGLAPLLAHTHPCDTQRDAPVPGLSLVLQAQSHICFNNPQRASVSDAFTIAAWLKPFAPTDLHTADAWVNSADVHITMLLSPLLAPQIPHGHGSVAVAVGTNAIQVYLAYTNNTLKCILAVHQTLSASQWHHIVVVVENPNINLYINGTLTASEHVQLNETIYFEPYIMGRSRYGDFEGGIAAVQAYSLPFSGPVVNLLANPADKYCEIQYPHHFDHNVGVTTEHTFNVTAMSFFQTPEATTLWVSTDQPLQAVYYSMEINTYDDTVSLDPHTGRISGNFAVEGVYTVFLHAVVSEDLVCNAFTAVTFNVLPPPLILTQVAPLEITSGQLFSVHLDQVSHINSRQNTTQTRGVYALQGGQPPFQPFLRNALDGMHVSLVANHTLYLFGQVFVTASLHKAIYICTQDVTGAEACSEPISVYVDAPLALLGETFYATVGMATIIPKPLLEGGRPFAGQTYAFTAENELPEGLHFNSDGDLIGSPTVPGSSQVVVAFTDANGAVVRTTVELEVSPALQLQTQGMVVHDCSNDCQGSNNSSCSPFCFPTASGVFNQGASSHVQRIVNATQLTQIVVELGYNVEGGRPPFSIDIAAPRGMKVDCEGRCLRGLILETGSFDIILKVLDSNGANISADLGKLVVFQRQQTSAPSAMTSRSTLRESWIIVLALGAVFTILACIALTAVYRARMLKPENFDEMIKQRKNFPADVASTRTPTELKRHCLEMLEVLGSGEFGTVQKAILRDPKHTGVPSVLCAVKSLRSNFSAAERQAMLTEALVMAQLDFHPNVCGLLGVVTAGEPTMIVLEFAELGDLKTFLETRLGMTELTVCAQLRICLDVAMGMDHITKAGLVHRDLAARNVLLDSNYRCKVSDFGFARDLENKTYYQITNKQLPLRWMPIEAIQDMKFTNKSDVWSFGVTVYEVFTRAARPYGEWSNAEVWEQVKQGYRLARPTTMPLPVYDMLLSCWADDPTDRPDFPALLDMLGGFLVRAQKLMKKLATRLKSRRLSTLLPNELNNSLTSLRSLSMWLEESNVMENEWRSHGIFVDEMEVLNADDGEDEDLDEDQLCSEGWCTPLRTDREDSVSTARSFCQSSTSSYVDRDQLTESWPLMASRRRSTQFTAPPRPSPLRLEVEAANDDTLCLEAVPLESQPVIAASVSEPETKPKSRFNVSHIEALPWANCVTSAQDSCDTVDATITAPTIQDTQQLQNDAVQSRNTHLYGASDVEKSEIPLAEDVREADTQERHRRDHKAPSPRPDVLLRLKAMLLKDERCQIFHPRPMPAAVNPYASDEDLQSVYSPSKTPPSMMEMSPTHVPDPRPRASAFYPLRRIYSATHQSKRFFCDSPLTQSLPASPMLMENSRSKPSRFEFSDLVNTYHDCTVQSDNSPDHTGKMPNSTSTPCREPVQRCKRDVFTLASGITSFVKEGQTTWC